MEVFRSAVRASGWYRVLTQWFQGNSLFRLGLLALTSVTVCCVFYLALAIPYMNRDDERDPPCDPAPPPPAPGPAPAETITLDSGDDTLDLVFRAARGTERDTLVLAASGDLSGEIGAEVVGLSGDGRAIPARAVVVRARALRSSVALEVCLAGKDLGREESGSYSGTIVFTDPRITPLSVPFSASIQARYVWLVAPLVLLLPVLALAAVPGTSLGSRRDDAKAWVAGLGAAGTVFGAQGLSNPSWGGSVALFGLVASMYVAAAGVVATVSASAGGSGVFSRPFQPVPAPPGLPD
ncbi:MAG: hypothetical protein ACRD0F_04120 [Acidimicrobiales bacterium]